LAGGFWGSPCPPHTLAKKMEERMPDQNSVRIEITDGASAWRMVETGLPNDPQFYTNSMRGMERAYPGRRIRAVDERGRVLDLL
jgi:hypothetical protein